MLFGAADCSYANSICRFHRGSYPLVGPAVKTVPSRDDRTNWHYLLLVAWSVELCCCW